MAQSLEQSKWPLVVVGWWSCSPVPAASPRRTSYPPWPFSETQLAACPPPRVLLRT